MFYCNNPNLRSVRASVHVGEILTDLQILGCELHKIRLAAGLHPSRYKGEVRNRRARKELGIGRRKRGGKGRT